MDSEGVELLTIEKQIRDFHISCEMELKLPAIPRAKQRHKIHKLCRQLQLISTSKGPKSNRYVVVSRPEMSITEYSRFLRDRLAPEHFESGTFKPANANLPDVTNIAENSLEKFFRSQSQFIAHLDLSFDTMNKFSTKGWLPSSFNLNDVDDNTDYFGLEADRKTMIDSGSKESSQITDRLTLPKVIIPSSPAITSRQYQTLYQERISLPIFAYKDEFISKVLRNQVTLLIGETGSGKSTQAPQFLLDYMSQYSQPCRIIVTEPRRIAAITVAERCANERGETVGETVGYQIRLEKKLSLKTALTFCTNGILLRTLIGAHQSLKQITHLFIDEVHERDKTSDFLLTVLKETMHNFPHLRIILMSASLNTEKFIKYFENPAILEVPGRSYNVKEFFLGDVLRATKYRPYKSFKRFGSLNDKENIICTDETSVEALDDRNYVVINAKHESENDEEVNNSNLQINVSNKTLCISNQEQNVLTFDSSPSLTKVLSQDEIDSLIETTFVDGRLVDIADLVRRIELGELSIHASNSKTQLTPLAIAAGRGVPSLVDQLLALGAMDGPKGMASYETARFLAQQGQFKTIVFSLDRHKSLQNARSMASNSTFNSSFGKLPDPEVPNGYSSFGHYKHETINNLDSDGSDPLIDKYLDDATTLSDHVDVDLIVELVFYILSNSEDGSLLVFLPGYEDLIMIKERLQSDSRFLPYGLIINMLHSQINPKDQKDAFLLPRQGNRKIILSTNIAEVSVTINDVVYVIDSGRMKEKAHDSSTGISSLTNVWISKANALQRKGRAGRCCSGVCYRLYSKCRFQNLVENPVPEMLRVPIYELCLQTKLLFPDCVSIALLLGKAPDPPAPSSIKDAINLLKIIGAMTETEGLTTLGLRISELPVDPQLGKMLLFGILLRCIDPILTLAACISSRDPFILPKFREEKRRAMECRCSLSPSGAYSDHIVYLVAFEQYLQAFDCQEDRQFCSRNYLSCYGLNMLYNIKLQLHTQLIKLGYVGQSADEYAKFNVNSNKWSVIKAALVAGCYPYLAYVDKRARRIKGPGSSDSIEISAFSTIMGGKRFNPKNTVEMLPTDWLLFNELQLINKRVQAKCITAITPLTYALFAGPIYLRRKDAVKTITSSVTIGEWDASLSSNQKVSYLQALDHGDVIFQCERRQATLIMLLREKLFSMFIEILKCPGKVFSAENNVALTTLITILDCEDKAHFPVLDTTLRISRSHLPVEIARTTIKLYNSPCQNNQAKIVAQSQEKIIAQSQTKSLPQCQHTSVSQMPNYSDCPSHYVRVFRTDTLDYKFLAPVLSRIIEKGSELECKQRINTVPNGVNYVESGREIATPSTSHFQQQKPQFPKPIRSKVHRDPYRREQSRSPSDHFFLNFGSSQQSNQINMVETKQDEQMIDKFKFTNNFQSFHRSIESSNNIERSVLSNFRSFADCSKSIGGYGRGKPINPYPVQNILENGRNLSIIPNTNFQPTSGQQCIGHSLCSGKMENCCSSNDHFTYSKPFAKQ